LEVKPVEGHRRISTFVDLLVWAASSPSDAKDSQAFVDIPNTVAFDSFGADPIVLGQRTNLPWKEHMPRMRLVATSNASKKAPQLWEKSWGQVQQRL